MAVLRHPMKLERRRRTWALMAAAICLPLAAYQWRDGKAAPRQLVGVGDTQQGWQQQLSMPVVTHPEDERHAFEEVSEEAREQGIEGAAAAVEAAEEAGGQDLEGRAAAEEGEAAEEALDGGTGGSEQEDASAEEQSPADEAAAEEQRQQEEPAVEAEPQDAKAAEEQRQQEEPAVEEEPQDATAAEDQPQPDAAEAEERAQPDAATAEVQPQPDAAAAEEQPQPDAATAEEHAQPDAATAEKQPQPDAAAAEEQAQPDAAAAAPKASEQAAQEVDQAPQPGAAGKPEPQPEHVGTEAGAAGEAAAAAQLVDEEAAWAGIPKQLPAWATECSQPPCKYSSLEDGPTNASVPWNSQFGEDAWLERHLFHGKRSGFYLELGALNGRDGCNTRWFHLAAGWRGVLIEANPGLYDELKRFQPDAIDLHAAVCGEFQTVHYHNDGFESGVFEFMSPAYKQLWHKDDKVEDMAPVQCVPLQFILDRLNVQAIDLWSLDVEGGELEILKTVDFSRLSVKVVVVETDGHDPAKDAAVVELLTANGFEAVPKTSKSQMNAFNTVLVHKTAWPLLAHAPDVERVET